MNKLELIHRIVHETGLSRRQVTDVFESIIDTIISELKAGNEIKISGFGVFSSKLRHARNGVNPQNPSESIIIPEVRVAKFKTGKTLRDKLKNQNND